MPISVISHITRRLCAPVLVVGVFVVAGCSPTAPAEVSPGSIAGPEINQLKFCNAGDDMLRISEECVPGQKVLYFASPHFDQELVIFAARNCDMRYSVVTAGWGIACIYAPIDPATDPALNMSDQ